MKLPTLAEARRAKPSALNTFIICAQPDDGTRHKWRRQLQAVLDTVTAENVPTWKHWTEVFGRAGNWRELAPETQRRWLEGRYAALQGSMSDVLLSRAMNEALASVGQSLPDQP